MRLEHVRLHNFRNYRGLELGFDGDLFLFVGANGQGKTNLLEALGLLVTGRSPRTSRLQELIHWGEKSGAVAARARRLDSPVEVEVRLQRQGRHTFLVQGKPVQRTSELLGEIRAVFFFPDDLQLVKGGPALRRRFLDLQLAQLRPAYRDRLIAYQRVVRQRNALLASFHRLGREALERLAPWDEQMVQLGAYLMRERAAATAALAPEAREAYREISGGKEKLDISYRPFWAGEEGERAPGREQGDSPLDSLDLTSAGLDFWEERFRQALARRRGEELHRRLTLVGPQRDDLGLSLDGRPARAFASQGQQRSLVLALKVAEVRYLDGETGEPPLFLLDDVFSELDAGRRRRLLQAAGSRAQVFLTTTGLEGYPDAGWDGREAQVFEIHDGSVQVGPLVRI